MVDVEALLAVVLAQLRTIPGLTVYDGHVPVRVPMAGDHIEPYVVLWSGLGGNPPELPANGRHDNSTVVLPFQTSIVAATAPLTRKAAAAVVQALTNFPVGTGRVRPNPDGFIPAAPVLDTSESPARFLYAYPWHLTTN